MRLQILFTVLFWLVGSSHSYATCAEARVQCDEAAKVYVKCVDDHKLLSVIGGCDPEFKARNAVCDQAEYTCTREREEAQNQDN